VQGALESGSGLLGTQQGDQVRVVSISAQHHTKREYRRKQRGQRKGFSLQWLAGDVVIWFDGPWVIGTEFAVDINFRATHSLSLSICLISSKHGAGWMDWKILGALVLIGLSFAHDGWILVFSGI
jgi:hypothetical protein